MEQNMIVMGVFLSMYIAQSAKARRINLGRTWSNFLLLLETNLQSPGRKDLFFHLLHENPNQSARYT